MVWHARVGRSFPDVAGLHELEALLAVSHDHGRRVAEAIGWIFVGPLVSEIWSLPKQVKSMSEELQPRCGH